MSMRVPCQYAIIQFMPYPETGEFANVGVVLACPQMRYLGARLAPVKRLNGLRTSLTALRLAFIAKHSATSKGT